MEKEKFDKNKVARIIMFAFIVLAFALFTRLFPYDLKGRGQCQEVYQHFREAGIKPFYVKEYKLIPPASMTGYKIYYKHDGKITEIIHLTGGGVDEHSVTTYTEQETDLTKVD